MLFLIGMRINKPWKFWQRGVVAAAMTKMLIELAKKPETTNTCPHGKRSIEQSAQTAMWASGTKHM